MVDSIAPESVHLQPAFPQSAEAFAERLRSRFPDALVELASPRGEVGIVFDATAHFQGCKALRDEFGFAQLIDVAGVDYLGYGSDEWDTEVSSEGFSRAGIGITPSPCGSAAAVAGTQPACARALFCTE